MQNEKNTQLERLIAKIDNDFNPDNSDWIPRVGAWAIDAMSQINVLPKEKVRKKLNVIDRIAVYPCGLDNIIKVYDSHGCEIKKLDYSKCGCSCGNSPSTGKEEQSVNINISDTTSVYVNPNNGTKEYVHAELINDKEFPSRYNYVNVSEKQKDIEHNYVLIDDNKIELNFDTDFICIEFEMIKTYCSKIYGCDLPVIPNNGILLEAISNYCMYKMLTRGYKHPVFNLQASQYGTNPYYMWIKLKEEARLDIINNNFDDNGASRMFRNTTYIQTFDPRR